MTATPTDIPMITPDAAPQGTRNWLDALGIGLSALCIVHCLALPFILIALPSLTGLFGIDAWFHTALAIVLPGIALVALVQGYLRHRTPMTLALGGLGLCFIWFALTIPGCASCANCATTAADGSTTAHAGPMFMGLPLHNVVNTVGSVLLISAHVLNWRACRSPQGCGDTCCGAGNASQNA